MDRKTLREKINELEEQARKLEQQKRSQSLGYNELIEKTCDLIDELRDRPLRFLAAPKEEKGRLFELMAEEAVISADSVQIRWRQPYTHIMRPALLDLREKLEPEAEKPADLGKRKQRASASNGGLSSSKLASMLTR